MITSFHIKNFRTCHDVTVTAAAHSTLLIGRNGAGKTNILSALQWGASVGVDPVMPPFEPFIEQSSLGLTLELDGHIFYYVLSARGISDSNDAAGFALMYDDRLTMLAGRGKEKLIFERDANKISIVDGRRRHSAFVPPGLVRTFDLGLSLAVHPGTRKSIKTVRDFLTGIRYYALDDLRAKSLYIRHDQYAAWLHEDDENISDGEVILYRLIRLHEERKDIFKELISILGKDELNIIKDIKVNFLDASNPAKKNPNIKKGNITSRSENIFYTVHFLVPSASSVVVSYQGLSFGTRRILQLIVALLYDRSTVMLVEQPEDGIHPGLLGKLMRVIHSYAGPTQFIMTSHSPSVVNSVLGTDLRIVTNNNGNTKCRTLTPAEMEDAKDFMNEEGQLAEYVSLLEQ